MNAQDILQNHNPGLDVVLDNSEYYDYELVYVDINIDLTLDNSEYYDYELVQEDVNIDVVLDSSEFYDYVLGDNTIDYVIIPINDIDGKYLMTEDDYFITSEDYYYIEYE